MKHLTLLLLILGFAVSVQAAEKPELVLYTYDSFVAKGGLGPSIFPLFEKKCGCVVRPLANGDGGQLLTRLQLDAERGKPTAQLVVGLDEPTFERARAYLADWGSWKPKDWKKLQPEAVRGHGVNDGFLPFDYGYLAFMADAQALKERKLPMPTSFAELLKPEWKRTLILEDPRTSTPGLEFVLYARAVGGSEVWSKLRPQWLTLAPGWDQAYGLFLKKEAPLVWSYLSSQAYHEEEGDKTGADRHYHALVLAEGNPIQVEGAALVKNAPGGEASRKLAQQFLEFLISPEVQQLLPKKQWMTPARVGVKLPPSFEHLPQPKKTIRLPVQAGEVTSALKEWSRAVE